MAAAASLRLPLPRRRALVSTAVKPETRNTNLLLLRVNFQVHAHVQKLREQGLVQQDVYSNSMFPTHFLQVSEDVDVCEHIHHHRDHLRGRARQRKGKPSAHNLTAPGPHCGPDLRDPILQHPPFSFCRTDSPPTVNSSISKDSQAAVCYRSGLGPATPPTCLLATLLHTGKLLRNIQ